MKLFYTKTAFRVLIGTLLTLLLFSAGTLAFTGCDEILDPSMGTLRLTNKSLNTVQRILIRWHPGLMFFSRWALAVEEVAAKPQ